VLRKENLEKEWEGGKKEGKKRIINDDAGNCVYWSEQRQVQRTEQNWFFIVALIWLPLVWLG